MAHAAVCPTFGGCDIDAPVKDAEHLRKPSLHSLCFARSGPSSLLCRDQFTAPIAHRTQLSAKVNSYLQPPTRTRHPGLRSTQSTSSSAIMSGFTFGQPSGNNANSGASKPVGGLFGGAGNTSGAASPSLFGGPTAGSSTPGGGLFGGGGASSAGSGLFGGGASSTPAASKPAGGLFGGAATAGASSTPSFGFGGAAKTGDAAKPSLFGGASTGATPAASAAPTPSFGFGRAAGASFHCVY